MILMLYVGVIHFLSVNNIGECNIDDHTLLIIILCSIIIFYDIN